MEIQAIGMVRGPVGYAQVTRGLAKALAAMGHRVRVVDRQDPNHDPGFPLDETTASLVGAEADADLTVAFTHPARWRNLPGRVRVGWIEYDSTHLPAAWAAAAEHVDLLLVPSEFVREVVVGAGVPGEKVAWVPFGYDANIYRPAEGSREGPLTFLHVAGPHLRKDTSGVIQAFGYAFDGVDDVRLIIKTGARVASRVPAENRPPRPYFESAPARELLGEYAPGDGRIRLIADTLSDAAMGDLYREAHVVVQPSFAEGFSLPTLEGMASGLAPIAASWGGHLDYCDHPTAFLIVSNLFPATDLQYDMEGDPSWPKGMVGRPDHDHLADVMRLVYDRSDLRAAKARSARDAAVSMTWENSARILLDELAARGLV